MADMGGEPKRESRLRWIIAAVVVPLIAAVIGAGFITGTCVGDVCLGGKSSSEGNQGLVSSTASPSPSPSASPSPSPSPGVSLSPSPAPRTSPPKLAPPDNSPLAKCQRREGSTVDVTLSLPGNANDSTYPARTASVPNPPNDLRPGDVLRLTGTGTIYVAAVGKYYGPDGSGERAPAGWTAQDLSKFGAVATYNVDPGGWLGPNFPAGVLSECTAYPANYPATRLFLRINAPGGDRSGNSGEWRFRLQVYRR